jgi:succinoglycan biosynthesis transport protein ExoP
VRVPDHGGEGVQYHRPQQASPTGFDLSDAFAILKRRKWYFAVPAVVISALAVALALVLPREYQSKAIILIEQPDIPPELVSSTVTTLADQRIQVIEQRFKATANLVRIIDKYNLYAHERDVTPITEIVAKMRDKIGVELISANVMDPRGGRPRKATIAFSVTFDYREAATAQKVASELVSWYLNENTRERQKQAQQAAAFLSGEALALERTVADLEAKLARFKEKYAGTLPEEEQVNRETLSRLEAELRDVELRAAALGDRRAIVEMELAYAETYAPPLPEAGRAAPELLSPAMRLKAALARHQTLKARYGDNHPDVVAVRNEIALIRNELGAEGDGAALTEDLQQRLREATAQLQTLKGRYADDHPDVVKTVNEIAILEEQLAAERRKPAPARPSAKSDTTGENPRVVQLKAQLLGIDAEGKALAKRRADLEGEIAKVRDRLARTPLVEQEYKVLARSLENAQRDYLAIRSKQLAAELGEALESEGKSERFEVIEPPTLPNDPERPNRAMIMGGGVAFALALGAGLMLVAEFLDPTIRSRKYLIARTGVAPLAAIPYIRTRAESLRLWLHRGAVGTAVVVVLVGGLAYYHYKVKPLDIALVTLERKLDAQVSRFLP